jgi:hypothetical protein
VESEKAFPLDHVDDGRYVGMTPVAADHPAVAAYLEFAIRAFILTPCLRRTGSASMKKVRTESDIGRSVHVEVAHAIVDKRDGRAGPANWSWSSRSGRKSDAARRLDRMLGPDTGRGTRTKRKKKTSGAKTKKGA